MTKIDIKIKFANKDIGYTFESENRVYLPYQKDIDKWTNEHFDTNYTEGTFNETSTFTATISTKITGTIEEAKSRRYVIVEIEGFKRYYFIQEARVENNITIRYKLALDTWNTYQNKVKFKGNANIERGHGVRFKGTSAQGQFIYDFSKSSDIMTDEHEEKPSPSTFAIAKSKLSSTTSEQWTKLRFHPKGWLYAVMKPAATDAKGIADYSYPQPYIVVPVVNDEKITTTYKGTTFTYTKNTYPYIVEDPKLQSLFFSPVPLFNTPELEVFTFDKYTAFEQSSKSVNNEIIFDFIASQDTFDPATFNFRLPDIDPDTEPANIKYEPKIWTEFVKNEIRFWNGDIKEIDLKRVVLNVKSSGAYYEPLIERPTIHSSITPVSYDKTVKLDSHKDFDNNKLYNYDGVIKSSNTATLPTLSNAYNNYMLSNANQVRREKNAAVANGAFGVLNGVLGIATGVAMMGVTGGSSASVAMRGIKGMSSIAGGFTSSAQSGFNAGMKVGNVNARLHDIGNTPATINGANINISSIMYNINNIDFGEAGLVFTQSIPSEQDLSTIHLKLQMYGYNLNRSKLITNIADIMPRRRYNYLKIRNTDEIMSREGLPTEVYNDIKLMFENGFRLWKDTSNINDFTIENFEEMIN